MKPKPHETLNQKIQSPTLAKLPHFASSWLGRSGWHCSSSHLSTAPFGFDSWGVIVLESTSLQYLSFEDGKAVRPQASTLTENLTA